MSVKITAGEWERVSRLLDEALEVEPVQRERWLESLSSEYADLRDTLRELLLGGGDAPETGDFLPRLEQLTSRADSGAREGDIVGPYRLIREIGAGGMASVWLAERADGSLKRQVALKLPRVLFSDGGLAARMARERDILAALEHPNIARLYDAGVDAAGRPFLAIEYVDGLPLDRYASQHTLTLRQRLDLFFQIARALAFAHGHLIVHRDLKPANILVTPGGDVRLLDFGIARLLHSGLEDGPQHTQFGARAFTPSYAAPEQFIGQPVTVSTDVYSLAVLLYELLTGVSPYATARSTPGAIEDAVVSLEPPPASGVARPADRRALRGDLDNILAKALKKAPAERYASVEAFAADVERHLQGLPVVARPLSRWYVARKFVRRNALTLTVGATVAVALIAGLGVALWQSNEAARQRAIALDRLTESEDANDFMSAVLIEGIRNSEAVTLDELLSRSETIAEASGRNDPRRRRFAVNFVAKWYLSYGLYERAEKFLARNIEALSATPSVSVTDLICTRAEAWANMGRRREAVEALMAQISRGGNELAAVANCLFIRGQVAAGERDVAGALKYALEGQRMAEQAGDRSVVDRASALGQIGYAYSVNEAQDEAQAYFAQAMQMFEQAGRAESDASLGVRTNWGLASINRGTPLQALALFEEALAIAQRRSPTGEPPAALIANKATALRVLERFDEAAATLRYATELAVRDGSVAEQVYLLHAHADLAQRMGEIERAQDLLNDALSRIRSQEGNTQRPASLMMMRHRLYQGQVFAQRGQLAQALEELDVAVRTYDQRDCCRGAQSMALVTRAGVLVNLRRLDAALADAQRAVEVAKLAQGRAPHSNYTGSAWLAVAHVHRARGELAQARKAFETASTQLAGSLGNAHPDVLEAKQALDHGPP